MYSYSKIKGKRSMLVIRRRRRAEEKERILNIQAFDK